MTPPSDLRARVLAAARKAPAKTRPVARRQRLGILLVVVLSWLAFFGAIGGARAGVRPMEYVVALGLGLGALAALLPPWLAGRGLSMVARPRVVQATALLAAFGGWALVILIGYGAWPETMHLESPKPWPIGCWIMTILFALGPLAACAALLRGTETASPRLTGAAVAVSATLFGILGATLHCPYAGVLHQLFGHGLPLVAAALLGAALFPLVVRRRDAHP